MFQKKDAKTSSITVTINWQIISLVLLVALAVCIYLWKPWNTSTATTRKITVTGQATVKGIPDEYQMNPYFEFTGDQTKAKADAAALATTITAKLKELGVKDGDVSSSTSAYDKYISTSSDGTTVDNLQLSYTIKVASKELAQKVQDYFLTTNAKGSFSPYATFSEAKRKELDAQARQNAIDDAKAKAEKSASQIGAKVGKVVTLSDGTSGGCSGGICPMLDVAASSAGETTRSSIPIQTGNQEFTTSVEVVFALQ